MSKQKRIAELAKTNKKADAKSVRVALDAIGKLERVGIRAKGYGVRRAFQGFKGVPTTSRQAAMSGRQNYKKTVDA